MSNTGNYITDDEKAGHYGSLGPHPSYLSSALNAYTGPYLGRSRAELLTSCHSGDTTATDLAACRNSRCSL